MTQCMAGESMGGYVSVVETTVRKMSHLKKRVYYLT